MPKTSTQILLADDNQANLLIAQTILERSGYVVTTAQNGSHALSLAKLANFDLILLDIMMPVMDGVRAMRRLRRDKSPNQDTPVFALTAYCSAQDQQRYRSAGFDAILSKPLKTGDIERTLKAYENNYALPLNERLEPHDTSNIPLLDYDIISKNIEIFDPEKLDQVINGFWGTIENQCVTISQSLPNALRADDHSLSQFRRAIHNMKGGSAAMGLVKVSEICRRLQNSPPSEIAGLMTAFTETLPQSRTVLTEFLSRTRELHATVEMGRKDQTKSAHHSEYNRSAIGN